MTVKFVIVTYLELRLAAFPEPVGYSVSASLCLGSIPGLRFHTGKCPDRACTRRCPLSGRAAAGSRSPGPQGAQLQSPGTGPGAEDPRNRSENRVKVAGDDKDPRVVVDGSRSLKSTSLASWRRESHRTTGLIGAPSPGTGCRSSD